MDDENKLPPPPPPSPSDSDYTAIDIDGGYKLEQVPRWVRDVNKEAYTPRYISIGPIHRDTLRPQGLKEGYVHRLKKDYVHRLKKYYVHRLIKEPEEFTELGLQSKEPEDCRRLLLHTQVEKARSFYAQEFPKINNHKWATMLLDDGCFIIMHLLEFTLGLQSRHTKWVSSVLKIDLILLENQLPFSVLECIMHFVFGHQRKEDASNLLKKLVIYYWALRVRGPDDWDKFDQLLEYIGHRQDIHHLVHLIHLVHYEAIYNKRINGVVDKDDCIHAIWYCVTRKIKGAICYSPLLFLRLLHSIWQCCTCYKEEERRKVEEEEEEKEEEENIPCATELHSLGVHFRKKSLSRGALSKYVVSLDDTKYYNAVEIPQLIVSSSEAPLLHNLIAWEHTNPHNLDDNNEEHFTKYAFLMYNLINSNQDVALLQSKGILLNKFGTDEQVVAYFKNLVLWNSRGTAKKKPDTKKTLLQKVCELCHLSELHGETEIDTVMDVLKHHVKKPEYRYWAEVKKYFSSPLQVFLVVTSIALFVSTILPAIQSLPTL